MFLDSLQCFSFYFFKQGESLLSGPLLAPWPKQVSAQQRCSECVMGYCAGPRFPNSFSEPGANVQAQAEVPWLSYRSRSLLWVRNCFLGLLLSD